MIKRPVGYSALIELLNLSVIPHYRQSYVISKGRGYVQIDNQQETHVYTKLYDVKDPHDLFQQLEFALKYDGVNLEILFAVFRKLNSIDVEAFIRQHPTSKYSRVLWFLYEFLTETVLDVPPSKKLKYINVLDPEIYFTSKGVKSARHGVNNNLIGNKDFCPMLRRTETLLEHIEQHYDKQAAAFVDRYDSNLIARASQYLYTKETLSSYAIEREKPNQDRMNRFINLLRKASHVDQLTKIQLIELQNVIVDPRFKDADYRSTQNYVGENIHQYFQKIHYISPKPDNIENLMQGLLETLESPKNTELNPVLMATIIAFGFVFIHPFEDGNGRLHRFLIHHILAKSRYTPPNIIFPISAVMLQKINEYDHCLESFSKPLMERITKYELSNEGVLSVQQPTEGFYSYIDYTVIAEYLFKCIRETLHVHFEKEIEFLVKYDITKSEIQAVVDLPDKLIDLFIKFVLQNQGMLSRQKREKYFDKLTDDEIESMQAIVCRHMLGRESRPKA